MELDKSITLEPKVILREIQNKNHFVFKRVFEELYPELVIYANGYLFDKASSEDVIQEVFVYLWEKSNKINLRTSLRAYLYSMARNRCLNVLKAIHITDRSEILEEQVTPDRDYNPDGFPDEENKIRHEQVLTVIENLPLKMRTIVELRFKENYRYKEIAEELNVSINTVKTQLKRAKVKLGELTVLLQLLLSILQ